MSNDPVDRILAHDTYRRLKELAGESARIIRALPVSEQHSISFGQLSVPLQVGIVDGIVFGGGLFWAIDADSIYLPEELRPKSVEELAKQVPYIPVDVPDDYDGRCTECKAADKECDGGCEALT